MPEKTITKTLACADCGTPIWEGSTRCKPCALRERHRIRMDNLDWSTRYVVEDRGYSTPCWIWLGKPDHLGYGRVTFRGVRKTAHRFFYEMRNGPIPEGLEPDHLCRVRACVNPDHIEAVTHTENMRRSLNPNNVAFRNNTCTKGHPKTPENGRPHSTKDSWVCLICARERWTRYRQR